MSSTALPVPSRSPLERFLRLFTDVREGEGLQVVLLALNVFLILTAYYVMKPVREALILTLPHGAEVKSYALAAQAALLLAIVPLYGALARHMNRRRLINVVTLFFIACPPVFHALIGAGVNVAIAYFLWLGIFSLMVIAQFWAFCNDIYTTDAGKRLFALIAFGASCGAVAGAFVSGHLIHVIGVRPLMLLGSVLLALSLVLFNVIERLSRSHGALHRAPHAEEAGDRIGGRNPFFVVAGNRYLLVIALVILLLNWVNATGEYILGRIVRETAQAQISSGILDPALQGIFIGGFFAQYFQLVNLLGMLLQLLVVSRLIKLIGVRWALCVLPVMAFGSYLAAALLPVLAAVRWVKTIENSIDYSLQNTVNHMLYLPTTREEKYKAKQTIDTFFVRAGDVLSALMVYVGVTWLSFSVSQFALANLALVLLWFSLSLWVGRRFQTLAPAKR